MKNSQRQIPRRWKRRAESFEQEVLGIEDAQLRFAVAFLIDALSDPDEPCAVAVLTQREVGSYGLAGFHVEKELSEVVVDRVGRDKLEEAVTWLRMRLADSDLAWLAWLFHRVHLKEEPKARYVEGRDGIVWDMKKRRVAKRRR